MDKPIITQEYLKSILNYDADNGVFTWKLNKARRIKEGDLAGYYVHGYKCVEIDMKPYALHRLAFIFVNGEVPDLVDHINGVKDDNRWVNLRKATYTQNNANRKISSINKSGYKGVYRYPKTNQWVARCTVNKVRKFLGYFDTPELASLAYKEFAKENFGEFFKEQ